MSLLHMDVDACRSTQTAMNTAKEMLAQDTNSVINAVNNTVGTNWRAGGATMYQQELQGWCGKMNAKVEALANLSTRLANKITEWEQTGGSFG